MPSLRASPLFQLAVIITLGLAGLIGLMTLVMVLQPGFLGMAHFSDPHHRVHDLTYGFLFGTAVVGVLAQLRKPSENVAGQLMALVPWAGLLLAAVLSKDVVIILSLERVSVAALALTTALLHPTGRHFFRSFTVSRVNWLMLALVIMAAVPLLAFASTNIGLQRVITDDHAVLGHYGFMAAFSFTVIGVGLLASLRPDGWWLSAWVAGLLPALLGLASVVFPDAASSLSLAWRLAATAWGATFVAAAEFVRRGDRAYPGRAQHTEDTHVAGRASYPDTNGGTGVESVRRSTTGTPRWVKAFGMIALVLLLLFLALHLAGGGFGPHTP